MIFQTLKVFGFICMILALPACGYSEEPKLERAWDSRPPEVVYAEGIIEGTVHYTFPFMVCVEEAASAFLKERNDKNLEKMLERLQFEGVKAITYLNHDIARHPQFRQTLRFDDPQIKKLYLLIADANKPMFEIIQYFGSESYTFTCNKDG